MPQVGEKKISGSAPEIVLFKRKMWDGAHVTVLFYITTQYLKHLENIIK